MSYTQTLVDNFNDNSFDTTIWARTASGTVVEASTVLTITPDTAASQFLLTKNTFNLTLGIFAFKASKTGTCTSVTSYFIGMSDSATPGAGNRASFSSNTASGTISFDVENSTTESGFATVGTPKGPTATTGWTGGDWWGMGNIGSDNIVHLYKSSDGQTWTEMAHMTLGGTFSKTAAHIQADANDEPGPSSGSKFVVDDASFFTLVTTHGKVRSAGAWVVPTAVKVRSGGAWVTPTDVKVRSGGAWVSPTN